MTSASPLDAHQIALIRDSFVDVLFDRDRAANLFYTHLFLNAPDTRQLFRGDMDAQGRLLIGTLAMIVTGLNDPAATAATVRELGRRHVGYGVLPAHYPPVGAALLHTVAQMGGGALDAATVGAWRIAYATIAATMTGADDV